MSRALPVFTFIISTACLLLATFYIAESASAFYSNSPSFQLEAEFGEFGGRKSSASYNLTDTGGGFAVGFGSSANYGTGSGFQYILAEIKEIVFVISTSSVNLGTLSTGSVSTSSHTITVSTNAADGYQVTVLENNNLSFGGGDVNDVSDGEVTAGSEEYGLATSQSGQDIAQDATCGSAPYNASAITGTGQSVASSSQPIQNDSTSICYAGSISGSTPAGTYSHILTYIATGTF